MAISREIFRLLINEGQELIKDVELYDREYNLEDNGRYVLVGVRQAGKSYMLYKRAKQLLAEGHLLEEIVYIDFDDERLLEMTAEDFDLILQTYKSMYSHKPILLFDEIQNIAGWEHFARRLANQKYLVYLTGSNAKMLSKDIHTTLGGRYLDEVVYPYSFAEYVDSQNIRRSREWMYNSERFEVEKALSEYMKWGGFPELLLYKNKRRWLNDIYEKILLNDIISRNKIKNEMAIRLFVKRLAENVTKPVSYTRLSNLIKASGVSTTPASIIQYAEYVKDAYVIFALENYASKFVEKSTVKKHYFIDNGLLSIFASESQSALLENLCAIQLLRKYEDKLYYYNKNIEVDFYVPEEGLAIQACVTLDDLETKDREINALKKLDGLENLHRMVVVTQYNEEVIALPNGKSIEIVPAWKWLLKE